MKIAPLDSDTLSHGDLYIAEWLERFDMTPADLRRASGLSEGYISALITGRHGKNPTLDALRKVARAIGVPVWALFLPPIGKGATEPRNPVYDALGGPQVVNYLRSDSPDSEQKARS